MDERARGQIGRSGERAGRLAGRFAGGRAGAERVGEHVEEVRRRHTLFHVRRGDCSSHESRHHRYDGGESRRSATKRSRGLAVEEGDMRRAVR